MKSIKVEIPLILLILLSNSAIFAQQYKYGNVSKALMELKECSFHKEADAMVTYVYGQNTVQYSYSEGFYTILKVKKQVKIFNNEAKDIGNAEFVFYSPKASKGRVKFRGLKGKTYNLTDGKIIETKLHDENIFETQMDNYFKKVSITMPAIQKNSVFEYEYELVSEYYSNIDDWMLQTKYPILYNEFYTSMPKYYNYQINVIGALTPVSDITNVYDEMLQTKSTSYSGTIGSPSLEKVNVPFTKRTIKFENIPPLEIEPFMSNISDSQGKITHQLIQINWPGEPLKNIAIDYANITLELLDSPSFGKYLNDGDFIKSMIDTEDKPSQLVLADRVQKAFQQKVKWNGDNHFRAGISGKTLFKDGTGDSGDINLNYIGALNYLGVPTFPVILSTRGNGTLHPIYPDYSDFNYVVALSAIGDKLYFSDASSQLPFGNLPTKCRKDKEKWAKALNKCWVA